MRKTMSTGALVLSIVLLGSGCTFGPTVASVTTRIGQILEFIGPCYPFRCDFRKESGNEGEMIIEVDRGGKRMAEAAAPPGKRGVRVEWLEGGEWRAESF